MKDDSQASDFINCEKDDAVILGKRRRRSEREKMIFCFDHPDFVGPVMQVI